MAVNPGGASSLSSRSHDLQSPGLRPPSLYRLRGQPVPGPYPRRRRHPGLIAPHILLSRSSAAPRVRWRRRRWRWSSAPAAMAAAFRAARWPSRDRREAEAALSRAGPLLTGRGARRRPSSGCQCRRGARRWRRSRRGNGAAATDGATSRPRRDTPLSPRSPGPPSATDSVGERRSGPADGAGPGRHWNVRSTPPDGVNGANGGRGAAPRRRTMRACFSACADTEGR